MIRLKELRKEKGMTLRQLSEKINISYAELSLIENEKRGLSIDLLHTICDYFNVSSDYLLGKSNLRNAKVIIVADSDGSLTEVQHQLLDATKGLTTEDLIEVNKYIEFLKSKKG